MLGLAGLGAGLLTVTGTLGGHLTGTATAVSQVLRYLGWEVYTTFYVPDMTLIVIAVAILVLIAIGALGARRAAA
jgi:ABC-type glucose/galactose transport system permease subunit